MKGGAPTPTRPDPTELDAVVTAGIAALPDVFESSLVRLRAVNELASLRRKAAKWDERVGS